MGWIKNARENSEAEDDLNRIMSGKKPKDRRNQNESLANIWYVLGILLVILYGLLVSCPSNPPYN